MSDSLFAFDRDQGGRYVCGADEAGRASIAGPLVAAAVRFDYVRLGAAAEKRLERLKESKQLTPRQRAELLPIVLEVADIVSVTVIPAGQIDRDGLHVTNMRALGSALNAVAVTDSTNLVDGFELKGVDVPHRFEEHGDGKSAAIAAASIVAKETRDRLMRRLDLEYPGYGFATHKGYTTPAHQAAILEMRCVSPVHRLRFRCAAFAALGLSQARYLPDALADPRRRA